MQYIESQQDIDKFKDNKLLRSASFFKKLPDLSAIM